MLTEKEQFDVETKKLAAIASSLYERLSKLPIEAYENLDLNFTVFEGVETPQNCSLAIILACGEPPFDLFKKILQAYPKHIKTLCLNHQILGEGPDAGIDLGWILASSAPELLKKFIEIHPEHAKTFNLNAQPRHKYNILQGVSSASLLVHLEMNVLEIILEANPEQMKTLDLTIGPSFEPEISHSLDVVLASIKPDLLDKILTYRRDHLKNIKLDQLVKNRSGITVTFASLLVSQGKAQIVIDVLLATDQKIPVTHAEVLSELYLKCDSLEKFYELMERYSQEELSALVSAEKTRNIYHILSFYFDERCINDLYEQVKTPEITIVSHKANVIKEILEKIMGLVQHFKNINDDHAKFKDIHAQKMAQNLGLMREIYQNFSEPFEQVWTSIPHESLLYYTYSSPAYLKPPKNLSIEGQLIFEKHRYLIAAPSHIIERDNHFVDLIDRLNKLKIENEQLKKEKKAASPLPLEEFKKNDRIAVKNIRPLSSKSAHSFFDTRNTQKIHENSLPRQ